jgi:ApbE superfamily uncharacterized protein (UPF0280 family)
LVLGEMSERLYRACMQRAGLVPFRVRYRETDLFVQAVRDLKKEVSEWTIEVRLAIESYARRHPNFLESFTPWPEDPVAAPVVQAMIQAGIAAEVGPLAAVAGAVAENVGRRCRDFMGGEVVVENGGDLFLWTEEAVRVALWAGRSPVSGRVGLVLSPEAMPLGVCTSSGTVGHSRSFGKADAVTVVSSSAALADAAATSVGNLIQCADDIDRGLETLQQISGVRGGLIVVDSKLGAWGQIELIPI